MRRNETRKTRLCSNTRCYLSTIGKKQDNKEKQPLQTIDETRATTETNAFVREVCSNDEDLPAPGKDASSSGIGCSACAGYLSESYMRTSGDRSTGDE